MHLKSLAVRPARSSGAKAPSSMRARFMASMASVTRSIVPPRWVKKTASVLPFGLRKLMYCLRDVFD